MIEVRHAAALTLAALCAAACGDTTLLDPMERQPKYRAYSENPLFTDGRAMRPLPPGTVPRERITMNPELTTGRDRAGNDLHAIPLKLDRSVIETGRKKFEIHCAVCHGLLGDGVSPVATQMSLRPPPSLHTLRNPSPGHVYQVVAQGFGVMPAYNNELSVQERWAVVSYVQALQRSQAATLAEAPADVQQKLREEKP